MRVFRAGPGDREVETLPLPPGHSHFLTGFPEIQAVFKAGGLQSIARAWGRFRGHQPDKQVNFSRKPIFKWGWRSQGSEMWP